MSLLLSQQIPTGWAGYFPDQLSRPEQEIQHRAFFSADRQPTPDGYASAVYPDQIDRLTVTADEQRAYFAPDRQPVPFAEWVDYDATTQETPMFVEYRAFFGVERQPLPDGHASVVYPDQIDRLTVTADEQRAYFAPDLQPLPDGHASAVYPDQIDRLTVTADEQRAYFAPDRQPVPFAEWVDYDVTTQETPPFVEYRAFFGPDIQPRTDFWTPVYPSLIDSEALRQQPPAYVGPTQVIPKPKPQSRRNQGGWITDQEFAEIEKMEKEARARAVERVKKIREEASRTRGTSKPSKEKTTTGALWERIEESRARKTEKAAEAARRLAEELGHAKKTQTKPRMTSAQLRKHLQDVGVIEVRWDVGSTALVTPKKPSDEPKPEPVQASMLPSMPPAVRGVLIAGVVAALAWWYFRKAPKAPRKKAKA